MMICQNIVHDIFLSGDFSPAGDCAFVPSDIFIIQDFTLHGVEYLQNAFSTPMPFCLKSTDSRLIVSIAGYLFNPHGNICVNMDAAMENMCLSVKFNVAAWSDVYDRAVCNSAMRRMQSRVFIADLSAPFASGIHARRVRSRFYSGRMLKVQTGVFTL